MRREARLLHDPAERDRDSSGGSFLSTLGLAQSDMFAVFTVIALFVPCLRSSGVSGTSLFTRYQ